MNRYRLWVYLGPKQVMQNQILCVPITSLTDLFCTFMHNKKVESAIDELHGTSKRPEGPSHSERCLSPPRTPVLNTPRPMSPTNEEER